MIGPPDCMVDIETVGTAHNSAILSIAAVRFDSLSRSNRIETLELLIDVDSCFQAGLSWDEGTMKWWSKQSPEAQFKAFDQQPRLDLSSALDQLTQFISNSSRLWCQGMNFDPVILESAYIATGKFLPWKYWQWRDSRTLMSMLQDLPKKDGTAHDALYDAVWQAKIVQECIKRLGIEEYNS